MKRNPDKHHHNISIQKQYQILLLGWLALSKKNCIAYNDTMTKSKKLASLTVH